MYKMAAPSIAIKGFQYIKDIENWIQQRALTESLVNEIIEKQEEYKSLYGDYIFPGSIVIAILDNKRYIIDGQHRIEAIKRLACNPNITVEEINAKILIM